MTAPLIPTSTRAVMRGIRTRTLVDTCAVQVRTSTDIPGGTSDSWVTSITLPCRLELPTIADNERFAAGQLSAKPDCVVAFAAGTSLAAGAASRLLVSGVTDTTVGTTAWARTLEIIGDTGPTSVTVERRYPCRDA